MESPGVGKWGKVSRAVAIEWPREKAHHSKLKTKNREIDNLVHERERLEKVGWGGNILSDLFPFT